LNGADRGAWCSDHSYAKTAYINAYSKDAAARRSLLLSLAVRVRILEQINQERHV